MRLLIDRFQVKRMFIALLLISFNFLSVNSQVNENPLTYSKVKVYINEKSDILTLARAGISVDNIDYKATYVEAIFSNVEIAILDSLKMNYEIVVKDMEAGYKSRLSMEQNSLDALLDEAEALYSTPAHFHYGSMGGYLTFDEVLAELDSMHAYYPGLIGARQSIGTSIEGRSLWMTKISNNPDVDENEREILYTGLHHAREPQSMTTIIYYMWYLLENYGIDTTVTNIVENRELFFIPVVNPDGYVYNQLTNPSGGGLWRKNRRYNGSGSYGVDLNRNYGYLWGYDNTGSSPTPTSETYRGVSGFSEPETQAVRDFVISRNFKMVTNYHGYGNWWIFPWGYKANYYCPDHAIFVAWSKDMTQYNNYVYGTPNQTVGYVVNGSADDWFYGEQTLKDKIFGYTPEIGTSTDGFWPAQSRIIPLANENVYPNLVFALAGGDDTIPATITNVHAINITGASAQITWTTDKMSTSIVDFGTSTTYGNLSYDTTVTLSHSVSLSGLLPNTVYHYRVKSTDFAGNTAISGDFSFYTGASFNYTPLSTTILQGTLNSGNYSSLTTNNAQYYVVNSTTSGTRKTDWYGNSSISQNPASVVKLTIAYDGKFSRTVTQTLHLYNWSTSSWVQVNSRSVSISDVSTTYSTTSPSSFISTEGNIRLRVLGTGTNKNFTGSGDFMQFSVETSGSEY